MADTYLPAEMPQAILNIPGGGNPTGTVIYYAGKTAPAGYLACDGTVYNIADYPALAAFFAENYDAINYWGGDGANTFAVPDWQGEFFRAAGTNGHENQGSGADVGVHQDGTEHLYTLYQYNTNQGQWRAPIDQWYAGTEADMSNIGYSYYGGIYLTNKNTQNGLKSYTSRPTNTSLLVCIKT